MNMLEELRGNTPKTDLNNFTNSREGFLNEILNYNWCVDQFYDSDIFKEWCYSKMVQPASMLVKYNGRVIEFLFNNNWYVVDRSHVVTNRGYYNNMPVYYMGLAIIFILYEFYKYINEKVYDNLFIDVINYMYSFYRNLYGSYPDNYIFNYKFNKLVETVGKYILIGG